MTERALVRSLTVRVQGLGSASTLTISAVLAPPALLAAAAPVVVAGVVAEGVVAGPAVGGAGLAVVVLVAHHVVGVAQLALVAEVHVLGPFLTDGQPAAGGQPADEVVLVLWRNEGRDETLLLRVSDRNL